MGREVEALEKILCHTRLSGDNIIALLCTQRRWRVLGHVAFDGSLPTVKGNALSSLNNLLVRSVPTRQLFADEGYPQKVVKTIQNVLNAHDTGAFLSQTARTTLALLSTLAIQYESSAYLFLPSLGPILDMLE
ncbi:hypothetical protein CTA1_7311 [Colletotrichum tanaceti]|uniref:Uncharacterized protein n=1 Tax=Colletotrichum tanaceti TaxID=1306861 RepID=A0A4V6DGG4_9PEZI|nr:hypothetical protein CTA1_7311 [Colletotrichum tanaceti]